MAKSSKPHLTLFGSTSSTNSKALIESSPIAFHSGLVFMCPSTGSTVLWGCCQAQEGLWGFCGQGNSGTASPMTSCLCVSSKSRAGQFVPQEACWRFGVRRQSSQQPLLYLLNHLPSPTYVTCCHFRHDFRVAFAVTALFGENKAVRGSHK